MNNQSEINNIKPLIGIYKIYLKANFRWCYVGQSTNILRRWKEHQTHSSNSHLRRAFEKYGIEVFEFKIIKECDLLELSKWEKIYILKNVCKCLKCKNIKTHYNLTTADTVNDTYQLAESTKQKLSISIKRYYKTHPETLEKMSIKGRINGIAKKIRLTKFNLNLSLPESLKLKQNENYTIQTTPKTHHLTQKTINYIKTEIINLYQLVIKIESKIIEYQKLWSQTQGPNEIKALYQKIKYLKRQKQNIIKLNVLIKTLKKLPNEPAIQYEQRQRKLKFCKFYLKITNWWKLGFNSKEIYFKLKTERQGRLTIKWFRCIYKYWLSSLDYWNALTYLKLYKPRKIDIPETIHAKELEINKNIETEILKTSELRELETNLSILVVVKQQLETKKFKLKGRIKILENYVLIAQNSNLIRQKEKDIEAKKLEISIIKASTTKLKKRN